MLHTHTYMQTDSYTESFSPAGEDSLLRSPSPSGTRAAARFECASKRQRYVGHDPWAAFCGRRAQTNQCAHLAPRTTCQLSCAGSVARQTLTA